MVSYGWFSQKVFQPSGKVPGTKISIIIPARNEENNILNCLDDLINQDYPKELFEIIIVDDDSNDKTYNIVETYIDSRRGKSPEIILIKSKRTDDSIAGKKRAIRLGIERSSGELIITSDADCHYKSKWISIISDYFENNNIHLLIGGVVFIRSNNIFYNMQSLEFLGLIASAAGFSYIGKPILANAANLSFRKKSFLEVENSRTDYDHASGDDIFLLLEIKNHYGASGIRFLKNREANVSTKPKLSLKELFSQRMRWVSKSKKTKEPFSLLVALITFGFNLGIFAGFITSIFYQQVFSYTFILLSVKIITDYPVIVGITTFTKRRSLLWLFVPLEIINILYVVVIATSGFFFKTKWKEKDVY